MYYISRIGFYRKEMYMSYEYSGEILAPAGNTEMLYAAVRSGADAVYLGCKSFSARRNAENFSEEELAEAIKYCHIRGVRVYLTLNTLIKDGELSSAVALARNAYNCGTDGIIVQDLGLAEILHRQIPDFPLHASTQMSVLSPATLPILSSLGFTQVVAAREMSKTELEALCREAKKHNITVEAFVHGALCMSVSGQCLLSAFLGSRSGNRGLCAGPCRLPFKVSGGTGYDLSLKDLSLTEHLRELYSIGVRSFKIEGRMKRPEYVAAATSACSRALKSGYVDEELAEALKNVFSRSGFTDGYYTDKLGRNMFGIRTRADVCAADSALPKLREIYRRELPRVPISLKGTVTEGSPTVLTLTDDEGNSVTATGSVPEKAEGHALTAKMALQKLSKFGSTPYYGIGGGVRVDDGLFMSASELNALRRKAVELLDIKRSEIKVKRSETVYEAVKYKRSIKRVTPEIYVRLEDENQISEAISAADAVIFPAEKNPSAVLALKKPVIAELSRTATDEKAIFQRLTELKSLGINSVLCGSLAAAAAVKKCGLEALADTSLNIFNSEALRLADKLGFSGAVISPELTVNEISKISSPIPLGMTVYGNLPLMLFKNCPLKNGRSCKDCNSRGFITDRLGAQFPVRCRGGYSELFNSVPIWMADKAEDTRTADFLILYFTRESAERTAEVINAYKNGLPPDIKHTRGLYYRGVL